MISGFNTDIEHGGVIYHVQTEDKGLETPLILSLIYTKGQILASKRTPYDDLVTAGFDEKILAERLNRQHKLLCAAIKAGRIEDLKRLSQQELDRRQGNNAKVEPPAEAKPPAAPHKPEIQPEPVAPKRTTGPLPQLLGWRRPAASPVPPVRERPASNSPLVPAAFMLFEPVAESNLQATLLEEPRLVSGAEAEIRVMVESLGQGVPRALSSAQVTLKVLGTSFLPLHYELQTNPQGIASFQVELPAFTTGRGVLVIKVCAGNQETELRRLIQPKMA